MIDGSTKTPFDAVIGLGSNIGDKAANIRKAVGLLEADGRVALAALSPLYTSPPWGVTEQDWFVNACAGLQTALEARDLLELCQGVETAMGRRREKHWGPRVIDVDILTYRSLKIDEADLKVPHPLIAERAFVLVPFADIAPKALIAGVKLRDLLERLDTSEIKLYDPAA